ncbi:Cullin binding-domain-containing protein [Kockovaella imperatae]|uniref:Defective in cullin neddylation protein n=1 Tax=Kockovaella imperatae TaxID=4999 RepID=A0A1Y1U7N4_9TREE|nr:Cullin binding-domain-containing protein [Kockovaella imperatae]ORX33517.1 Cullin binding-domain-containing protein [Kockovaella imperatae]
MSSLADAQKLVKKHRTVEGAIEAFYSDPSMQRHATTTKEDKTKEKKLGDVWEKFKDPSDPKLIKIDGTMQLCEELDIDPSTDSVLFCLAADLGSKVTGEWEKGPWVSGWSSMPGNIDSIEGMKARLPALREKLNTEPAYFKKVYMHTFDLVKAPGARTLALDTAIDMWTLFIPPALQASPSALSHLPSSTTSLFSMQDFESWIEFQRQRGKAVSKDTWTLFIDFVRTIDADFKDYDEEAAWPSTIDDFVEHVRASRKA